MPIYEYECGACEHQLDALEKISDKPMVKCPECGRRKLKRLVSAPKFRLKGEGWYETDFKKENQRNLADAGDGKPADKADKKDGDKAASGNGAASDGAKTNDTKPTKAKTDPPPKAKSKSGDDSTA